VSREKVVASLLFGALSCLPAAGAAAARPRLSVGDAKVVEPVPGIGRTASFKVTLSAGTSQTVSVTYATADGSAVAGLDYAPAAGQLTFPAATGPQEQTVEVPVLGDRVPEGNETFTLELSDPVEATIEDGTGSGTILRAAKGDLNEDGRSDVLVMHGEIHGDECPRQPRFPHPPNFHLNREPGYLVTFNPETGLFVGVREESLGDGIVSGQWQAKATGDFDGDGALDLFWELWDHLDAEAMAGEIEPPMQRLAVEVTLAAHGPFSAPAGAAGHSPPDLGGAWVLVGSGDFLGADPAADQDRPAAVLPQDGLADLLWHNAVTGQLSIWAAQRVEPGKDPFPAPQRHAVPSLPPDWVPLAVADLDGDALPEIVWRQNAAVGYLRYWHMSGLAHTEGELNPNRTQAQNWTIMGAGDFDGDGFDDLLWRNTTDTSQQLVIWLMQGPDRTIGGMVTPARLGEEPGNNCKPWTISGPR
jgi:hypothetical protein